MTKHIWNTCCHLVTETGNYFLLIVSILFPPFSLVVLVSLDLNSWTLDDEPSVLPLCYRCWIMLELVCSDFVSNWMFLTLLKIRHLGHLKAFWTVSLQSTNTNLFRLDHFIFFTHFSFKWYLFQIMAQCLDKISSRGLYYRTLPPQLTPNRNKLQFLSLSVTSTLV